MLTASNVLVIHDARGQLLVGPRGAFVGGEKNAFLRGRSTIEGHIVSAANEQSEIAALRDACFSWHIDDSSFQSLTDRAVIELVARACDRGQLGAVYLDDGQLDHPLPIKSLKEYKADKKADNDNNRRPKQLVPDDTADRFLEVLDLMIENGHLEKEAGNAAGEFLQGETLSGLISILTSRKFLLSKGGAKLLGRLIGGPFFAAATLLWSAVTEGRDLVAAIEKISEAAEITIEAKTYAELDKAAALLAAGLAALSLKTLDMLIGKLKPKVTAVPAKGGGGRIDPPRTHSSSTQKASSKPSSQNKDIERHNESDNVIKTKNSKDEPLTIEKGRERAKNIVNDKSFSTKESKATFYSGPGNREKALADIKTRGAEPIDITDGGRALDAENLYSKHNPLYAEADEYWGAASEKYAKEANGNIIAHVDGASPHRVFAKKELPILLENDKVKSINGIDRKFLQRIEEEIPGSAFQALSGGM
jgi:hypothetical protein